MVLGVVIGLAVGVALGLVWHQLRTAGVHTAAQTAEARLADTQAAASALTTQLGVATAAASAAETGRAVLASELALLKKSEEEMRAHTAEERQRLTGAFAELSAVALQKNNEQFLGLQKIEVERKGAYEGLSEKVAQLHLGNEQLQKETRNLVTALRSPQTRGRWGEIQLRRVVEMAGMLPHCDFEEQVSTNTEDGRLRPDMIVHVPGGGEIVVDAKVPLEAFLQLIDADDDAGRTAFQNAHARQLRAHVDQLSKKEYWKQFDRSPQQVVAFIPGDQLLSVAYEADPTLQEHAMANGVLLTTPTMLIALLRTVAFGWRQESLAENAREVQKLGAELYERLRTMSTHMQKLQRSLTASVSAYNDAVGSLESRVLVSARRFPSLGVVGIETDEIADLPPVEASPRLLQAIELVADRGGESAPPAALPEAGAAAR